MSRLIWRALRPFVEEQRDRSRALAGRYPSLRHSMILMPPDTLDDPKRFEAIRSVAAGLARAISGGDRLNHVWTFTSPTEESDPYGNRPGVFGVRVGSWGESIFFGESGDYRDVGAFNRLAIRVIAALKTRPKKESILPAYLPEGRHHIWGTTMNGVLLHFEASTLRPRELRFLLDGDRLKLPGYPDRTLSAASAADLPLAEVINAGDVYARVFDAGAFEVSAAALDTILASKSLRPPPPPPAPSPKTHPPAPGPGTKGRRPRRRWKKLTKEEHAMRLFTRNPTLTKPELASAVGCHEKSIYNMVRLCRLMDLYQAQAAPPFQGTKDVDGNLEAWSTPEQRPTAD